MKHEFKTKEMPEYLRVEIDKEIFISIDVSVKGMVNVFVQALLDGDNISNTIATLKVDRNVIRQVKESLTKKETGDTDVEIMRQKRMIKELTEQKVKIEKQLEELSIKEREEEAEYAKKTGELTRQRASIQKQLEGLVGD